MRNMMTLGQQIIIGRLTGVSLANMNVVQVIAPPTDMTMTGTAGAGPILAMSGATGMIDPTHWVIDSRLFRTQSLPYRMYAGMLQLVVVILI